MIKRDEIVAEARRWIGTPYLHQASKRGAGTDCLGLIRGVWREIIGQEPQLIPIYTEDWSEPNHHEELMFAATRWMTPKALDSTDVGDVLLFRMCTKGVAKHLGITSMNKDGPTFIHAYSHHSVVETSLSSPWARRIAARFEFPAGAK